VFQRTMHNRVAPAVQSREVDGLNLAAIAPLVAVVVALGLYPSFVIERSEEATTAAIEQARSVGQEVAER
jgi:NADH:ubiquinone oxidoreductase subunit 4 (subunit M)